MARKPADSLLAARRGSDTTWHGTAFVVEALVLLVFLAFALAGTGADAEDAYVVSREVVPERTEDGTLYRANITVSCGGEAVYELETSRYVSDGTAGTDIGRAPDAAAAEGGDVA